MFSFSKYNLIIIFISLRKYTSWNMVVVFSNKVIDVKMSCHIPIELSGVGFLTEKGEFTTSTSSQRENLF